MTVSNRKEVRARLLRKKSAHYRCFMGDDGELTKSGKLVLADLKEFCCGDKSTTMVSGVSGMVDPFATMHANGKREVYERLLQMLYLPDRTIIELEEEQ